MADTEGQGSLLLPGPVSGTDHLSYHLLPLQHLALSVISAAWFTCLCSAGAKRDKRPSVSIKCKTKAAGLRKRLGAGPERQPSWWTAPSLPVVSSVAPHTPPTLPPAFLTITSNKNNVHFWTEDFPKAFSRKFNFITVFCFNLLVLLHLPEVFFSLLLECSDATPQGSQVWGSNSSLNRVKRVCLLGSFAYQRTFSILTRFRFSLWITNWKRRPADDRLI